MEVCRAITFINYHIPMVLNAKTNIQYSTLGFFDGMLTESIDIFKDEEELKRLWHYGLRRTADSEGRYSYQNIFCFSKNEWNRYTDEYMWLEETDKEYPLTFIVFVQLRNYACGSHTIESRCREFNNILENVLEKQTGIYYTYCTIDKNDFVVSIKCKNYKMAVRSIKSLHSISDEVIYSYTVLSISNNVLNEISDDRYKDLYTQTVDSIAIKGITNSFDPKQIFSLDEKYDEFCRKLVEQLYPGEDMKVLEKNGIYKIYDILGEDDFRLIARNVNLGLLLKQFAEGGKLCYEEEMFRFYLFSSKLMINTSTDKDLKSLTGLQISEMKIQMQEAFKAPMCIEVQENIKNIAQIVSGNFPKIEGNEKVIAFCHAIWQLLQSMKTLEIAPTKKYDFLSLFEPFSYLVKILEEKIKSEKETQSNIWKFSENSEIYDFIHKISMTLHGTLRTDIQFFQVRDFNVIVHYAPAKLRAFYSIWALKISDYYNMFNVNKHEYSFIFAPGMFSQIGVRQLFASYEENSRLMLITIPERLLYSTVNLAIISGHEVSHFVGTDIRKRNERHVMFRECIVRLMSLELNYLRYYLGRGKYQNNIEQIVSNSLLGTNFIEYLENAEKVVKIELKLEKYEYHSKNSIKIIEEAFSEVAEKYIEKIIIEECCWMNEQLLDKALLDRCSEQKKYKEVNEIREISFGAEKQMLNMITLYKRRVKEILQMLQYITSEAFADLCVVLTLNLDLKSYFNVFVQSDVKYSKVANLVVVRISLVIQAITKLIEEDKLLKADSEFVSAWSREVYNKLPYMFLPDTTAFNIALQVYGYMSNKRDCNKKISNYKTLYNYSQKEFKNSKYDFLNDELIWESLCDYINHCAEHYTSTWNSNSNIQKKKEELVQTYKNISKKSGVEIVQEIENFLASYEREKMSK